LNSVIGAPDAANNYVLQLQRIIGQLQRVFPNLVDFVWDAARNRMSALFGNNSYIDIQNTVPPPPSNAITSGIEYVNEDNQDIQSATNRSPSPPSTPDKPTAPSTTGTAPKDRPVVNLTNRIVRVYHNDPQSGSVVEKEWRAESDPNEIDNYFDQLIQSGREPVIMIDGIAKQFSKEDVFDAGNADGGSFVGNLLKINPPPPPPCPSNTTICEPHRVIPPNPHPACPYPEHTKLCNRVGTGNTPGCIRQNDSCEMPLSQYRNLLPLPEKPRVKNPKMSIQFQEEGEGLLDPSRLVTEDELDAARTQEAWDELLEAAGLGLNVLEAGYLLGKVGAGVSRIMAAKAAGRVATREAVEAEGISVAFELDPVTGVYRVDPSQVSTLAEQRLAQETVDFLNATDREIARFTAFGTEDSRNQVSILQKLKNNIEAIKNFDYRPTPIGTSLVTGAELVGNIPKNDPSDPNDPTYLESKKTLTELIRNVDLVTSYLERLGQSDEDEQERTDTLDYFRQQLPQYEEFLDYFRELSNANPQDEQLQENVAILQEKLSPFMR
jgi:hypothetical protein